MPIENDFPIIGNCAVFAQNYLLIMYRAASIKLQVRIVFSVLSLSETMLHVTGAICCFLQFEFEEMFLISRVFLYSRFE